jgi:hypothetical protein
MTVEAQRAYGEARQSHDRKPGRKFKSLQAISQVVVVILSTTPYGATCLAPPLMPASNRLSLRAGSLGAQSHRHGAHDSTWNI